MGMMAGPFDWAGVEAKLKPFGLWDTEIIRRLTVCESAMLAAESRSRDEAVAPARRAKAGRRRR
jgi:hypothetical protein